MMVKNNIVWKTETLHAKQLWEMLKIKSPHTPTYMLLDIFEEYICNSSTCIFKEIWLEFSVIIRNSEMQQIEDFYV